MTRGLTGTEVRLMKQSIDTSPTSAPADETSTVPTSSQSDAALVDGNPIIDRAEKALRCFEGDPLDRQQAERLLSMWGHRDELSDDDWTAVLDRFGEDTDQPMSAVDESDVEDIKAVLFRLEERLRATGNTQVYSLGIVEGERRAALRGVSVGEKQAYARGYVDGCAIRLGLTPVHRLTDPDVGDDHDLAVMYRDELRENFTAHVWVVRSAEVPGTFRWTCACGYAITQEVDETDIRARLRNHVDGELDEEHTQH